MADSRRLLLPALAVALLVASPSPSAAAPVVYGDVEVGLESEPRGQPMHGYTEYRIWVRNRSTERSRQVTLELPARGIGGAGLRSISRTVEVGPGSIVVASLLQPSAPPVNGNGVIVSLDGRRQDDPLPLTPASGRAGGFYTGRPPTYHAVPATVYPGGGGPETLVLLSQRVDERLYAVPAPGAAPAAGPGAMLPGMPGGGGMPGGAPMAINAQTVRADVGVSTWSDRWLAYTRYDGVTLTREDLEELERGAQTSQAIRQAIWQYVEAGGTLVVLGPGNVKLPPAYDRTPQEADGLRSYDVGFGVVIVTPDRDSAKWDVGRWGQFSRAFSQTAGPWRGSGGGMVQNNEAFPVVDGFGMPIRGLFLLMIVFAIVIGPVNLVVLTRRKRRIWLLWTVPALSLLFCAAVFGYMLVAEGWTGHARVAGLTLLDENGKRATTLGKAAFYSPMTPGDGLHFAEETEVHIPGEEHPAFTSGCSIHWSGEQHLTRGWVTARVPAHFLVRKSQPLRRERLTVQPEADGGLSVTNALGTDVRELTVADAKGRLYRGGPIAAGARATLTPDRAVAVGGWRPQHLRNLYTNSDWPRAVDEAARHPEQVLGPNSYLAVVESSPFLEQPLGGARVRPATSAVLGLLPVPR
ncbi:MAG: hypothetical protein U0736_14730 [Gemmataceae bacterium]